MVEHYEGRGDRGPIIGLLGPTNTGKTYRAIERMLECESGMMGLPLRLLAREVYDKVSLRVGEQAVALVTGEEKRVPKHPRYWICTVEAMPLRLEVDFLAIDEIQLIAHPERGHVFTDRLLHARGRVETWFLGSDIIEGLVRELVPAIRVRKLPRLSRISYAGQHSMRTLPKRSAVVVFSLPQVYELADAIRHRRGGAAVVLGALSPRVRNAQVALYQAGEVDYLVATDAIGMGLNLELDHVALASRTKFDGFEVRELENAEMAQIVGRAGRYLRDGTFGTLNPEPELHPKLIESLEQHRFVAQRFAYFRSSALDFSSVDALLKTLARRPPSQVLKLAPESDDLLVLRVLAKKPEVLALADGEERVRLLWDVCRIPNYEKHIPEHQADHILPYFEKLATSGFLPNDMMEERLRRLERTTGDIHHLMERLASVRTLTYATHQSGWVQDRSGLAERARALEDSLSDQLHQRLLERFVVAGMSARKVRTTPHSENKSSHHHPFAKLRELEGMHLPQPEPSWVERLVEASFDQIELSARGELFFDGQRVLRFTAGQHLTRPALRFYLPDDLDGGARTRIERRLQAHVKDLTVELLDSFELSPTQSAPLRGLVYQLSQGLGTVDKRAARAQLELLDDEDRMLLERAHIHVGRFTVYASRMLSARMIALRFALVSAVVGRDSGFDPEWANAAFFRLPSRVDRSRLLELGFVPLRSWAIRCDLLERIARASQPSPERRADEATQDAKAAPQATLEAIQLHLSASEEEASTIAREIPHKRKRKRGRP